MEDGGLDSAGPILHTVTGRIGHGDGLGSTVEISLVFG
jgi:hypothetical protein